jgi:hypothetical protein
MAPGAHGNPLQDENFEFFKQKTYLEWNPPKLTKKDYINYNLYDKVKPYDITKEN